MVSDFRDRAAPYYDDATVWLEQNYGKALVAVGVLSAVGMIGYFIASRSSSSSSSSSSDSLRRAS